MTTVPILGINTMELQEPIRLDLGCGIHKKKDFLGVDIRPHSEVDIVCDLRQRWMWPDNSVTEAHSSHFVEHLTAGERIHFVNELYRILIPGGVATIITPHWCSTRAYGDLTHQWPPVSEQWFFYLKKQWRDENAPHNDGYTCDFEATWGYGMHPMLMTRAEDYRQHALNYYKEAVQDIHATLTKR